MKNNNFKILIKFHSARVSRTRENSIRISTEYFCDNRTVRIDILGIYILKNNNFNLLKKTQNHIDFAIRIIHNSSRLLKKKT